MNCTVLIPKKFGSKTQNVNIIGASTGQPVSAASAVQASVVGGLAGGVKRQRSPSPPRTCASGQTISVGLPTRYD